MIPLLLAALAPVVTLSWEAPEDDDGVAAYFVGLAEPGSDAWQTNWIVTGLSWTNAVPPGTWRLGIIPVDDEEQEVGTLWDAVITVPEPETRTLTIIGQLEQAVAPTGPWYPAASFSLEAPFDSEGKFYRLRADMVTNSIPPLPPGHGGGDDG